MLIYLQMLSCMGILPRKLRWLWNSHRSVGVIYGVKNRFESASRLRYSGIQKLSIIIIITIIIMAERAAVVGGGVDHPACGERAALHRVLAGRGRRTSRGEPAQTRGRYVESGRVKKLVN